VVSLLEDRHIFQRFSEAILDAHGDNTMPRISIEDAELAERLIRKGEGGSRRTSLI